MNEEHTGEDAASAASYVLNKAEQVLLQAQETQSAVMRTDDALYDLINMLNDFVTDAKTAAASALTQKESK